MCTQEEARLTVLARPIWSKSFQLHTRHNILPFVLPLTSVTDGVSKTRVYTVSKGYCHLPIASPATESLQNGQGTMMLVLLSKFESHNIRSFRKNMEGRREGWRKGGRKEVRREEGGMLHTEKNTCPEKYVPRIQLKNCMHKGLPTNYRLDEIMLKQQCIMLFFYACRNEWLCSSTQPIMFDHPQLQLEWYSHWYWHWKR